jgi:hypothetical protein
MFARPRRRSDDPAAALYLELLKLVLTRITFREEGSIDPESRERGPLKHELRYDGRDWPLFGETMIGVRRLDQLQEAVETVLAERVPGDLIETGVWRGGACILMRAVLARTGRLVTSAAIILCISFASITLTPNVDIRVLAFGLAAGILIDATIIRSLLVPALVGIFGRWNWWMPTRLERALRVNPRPALDPPAYEQA